MKKLFIIAVLSAFFLFNCFLVGCSQKIVAPVTDTVSITGTIMELKHNYAIVETIIRAHGESFTEDEMATLADLDAVIDMIIAKLESIRDIERIDIHDIDVLYFLARDGYGKAAGIVANHIGEFDSSQKAILKTFDMQAREVAAEVDRLLEEPTAENLRRVFSILPTILQVGFKIVTLLI